MKSFFSLLILFALSITYLSAQTWNLVWSDEFDGNSLNTANWQFDVGTGAAQGLNGWGNNELQYYRNGSNNLTVGNGVLSIIAKEESFGGQDYTSARIKTAGLQAWEQGKIEARIKLPTGQGIWPAFWMLREDPLSDPDNQFYWPGEIDIVETVGHQPTTVHGTAHYGTPGEVISNGSNQVLNSGTVSSDYHIYSVEWYDNLIVWKLDGVQFHELHLNDVSPHNWLFDQDYHALLNVAVGGNWPGSPNGATVFPVQMDVDYVRVYELNSSMASVTFNVDMRCYSGQPEFFNKVGLEGPTLGPWCGGCNPLTDINLDGIWTITLDLPLGDLEYKYSVNDFEGQEDLVDDMVAGASCAPITDFNSYANRVVTITPGAVFNDSYGSCEVCDPENGCTDLEANNYSPSAINDDGSCTYDVTLNVDMNCYTEAFTQVEVTGPFTNWCAACIILEDPDLDGVYSVVISRPAGELEYKYSLDNFTTQEDLVDDVQNGNASCAPVTDGATYANRVLTVEAGATADDAYGSCDPCVPGETFGCMDSNAANYNASATLDNGSCKYEVTFLLDMNDVAFSFTTPEVNGQFNGWCGSCNPMTDLGGGMWSITLDIVNGMHEFEFSTDEGTNQEALTEGDACTLTTDDITNRIITVTGDMTYGPVTWESCPSCPGDINADGMVNTSDFIELNSTFGSSCSGCPSDINGDGLVNVDDFLLLNSLFGTSCY